MTNLTIKSETVALAAAEALIGAAKAKAGELGIPVTTVVVDEGGHVKALGRMDGAPLLSLSVALDKAYTAAATQAPTHELLDFINQDAGSAASMPSHPRFTVVAGGLAVEVNGVFVGGIGVSGGRADDDLAVAQAALATVTVGVGR